MSGLGKKRRLAVLLALACGAPAAARRPDGRLELAVVDAATGEPIATRIELTDARGRPVDPRRTPEPLGAAPLGDHAYLDGAAVLGLRRGAYRFTLDAGPEYRTQHGHFEIARHADDTKRIEMTRAADLAAEGWLAADLGSRRPASDDALLRRAESLAYTPTLAAEWDGGRWAEPETAGRQPNDPPRGATALWSDPRGVAWLIDPDGSRSVDDLPTPGESSVEFLAAARAGGWRTAASVTSRELPLWVAHGVLDAVVVLDGWLDSPAGRSAERHARPRDEMLYPGPGGPTRWRRALYESLLDAGVRLPPVAVSGSGLNTTPIGSSRVYAHTDSAAAWWDAADDLAVVVTGGPLLRPLVEGAPPGQTFLLPPGGVRSLSIALGLTTRTPVDYLEIVKDGRVLRTVRLPELAAAGGRLPEVEFDAPGWLSIAVAAQTPDRYELAMSAPWFVIEPAGGRIDPEDVTAWRDALAEARETFGGKSASDYDKADQWWRKQTAGLEPQASARGARRVPALRFRYRLPGSLPALRLGLQAVRPVGRFFGATAIG